MFSISNLPRRLRRRTWLALAVTILVLLSAMLSPQRGSAQDMIQQAEAQATSQPLIHVPYFSDSANPGQGAVFWFGKVEHTTNHANVRIAYDNDALVVVLHIFDRRVSYEAKTNAESDLTQWDSVSLYLDPLGDLAAPLSINAYRFDAQISAWEPRTDFERQYRWDRATWTATSVAFETEAGFRANPNDDSDDRGWLMSFRVPFTTLSLPSTPIQGSVFRMALSLHDRDELDQAVLPDQNWPRNVALDQPATWGRISFGIPTYNAPTVVDPQKVSLRHGVAGVVAPDAAVGGHSTCGTQYDPNFFDGWGEANYAGFAQFNIQNQWDVADWPCFSKYYVTFPLDALPATASIASASLTLYLFGNAGYSNTDPKPSFMQVARVGEDWSEQALTWNNAPDVLENYSYTWVHPAVNDANYTVTPYTWDLARAVTDAHAGGQPLRLAIYSSDGDYHSGKYFWSADSAEGVRPRLDITWGTGGFALSTIPIKQMIRDGETAEYELNVGALRDGESVTIEVGPSSPPGLELLVTPQQLAAPGGKAVVALTDADATGSGDARVYRVPVTIRNGSDTRTAELVIFVNGRQLFLPALRR